MRRLVTVLGVLAMLCVLGAATLAMVHRPAPSRQWLRGHGLEVAVPADRWRLEPASQAIRYDADALVRAPAVLDAGFCPSSTSSSRAFVGLLPPLANTVPKVVMRVAATWAGAITGRAIGLAGSADDGRVDIDVPVPSGPCNPTTAHLTVVGRSTPGGVVALVLVRDAGEPGDLTEAEAEAIVGSLRPLG